MWDNAQEHGSFHCPSVTKLFNLSISTEIIPHKWKIILSSIVPIPKSSVSTDNCSNYRPISFLSVISKLLERHISSVVLEHLIERENTSENQWRFTPGKSPVMALWSSFHNIFELLVSGADVTLVVFYLCKAFLYCSSSTLLQKLSDCGMHQHILQWITCNLRR